MFVYQAIQLLTLWAAYSYYMEAHPPTVPQYAVPVAVVRLIAQLRIEAFCSCLLVLLTADSGPGLAPRRRSPSNRVFPTSPPTVHKWRFMVEARTD